MERLTKKLTDNYYTYNCGTNEFIQGGCGDYCNKLGKLEDIEEELGIPLEVLFKALKDGVYVKFEENKILKADIKLYYNLCQNEFKIRVVCLEIGQYEDFEWEDYLFVKNYGVTWWLEKPEEEIKNEEEI